MGVIREDVVVIKFDVQDNPFAELTSGIDDFKVGLKVVDNAANTIKKLCAEAQLADSVLSNMGNSIRAPAELDRLNTGLKLSKSEAEQLANSLKSLGGLENRGNALADLDNLNQRIQVEINLQSALQKSYTDTASKYGATSEKALYLQKTILETGNALNKMKRQSEEMGGAVKKVQDIFDKMDSNMKKMNPKTFSELTKSALDLGKNKLSSGLEKLSSVPQKATAGFNKLKTTVSEVKNIKLSDLGKGLDKGLGKGVLKVGLLASKLKEAAGIGLEKPINAIKNIASGAATAMGKMGSGLIKATGGLVKGTVAGITAVGSAVGTGAKAAFQFGSEYETSLSKVSTMADTSATSMDDISNGVLKLSNNTGEGAAGLNEAVSQALSAGADTNGVIGLVETAVKTARGGFTDTSTAVEGLTSTLNAFGMATEDAEGLANKFQITQNKGKTTFGELASSIGSVAPTANSAGIGVDSLLASTAALTSGGATTSEAMTGIEAALSDIMKPTSEASKMAESLGLDFSATALKSKGLVTFLNDVKTATGGDADKMSQLFGSVDALNSVLGLTSDEGMNSMKENLSEMETNTSALDDAYNTMSDTAQVSVQKGLNSFKNIGIGVFNENKGLVSNLTGLYSTSGQELYQALESGGMDGLAGQIGVTLSNVVTEIAGLMPELINTGVEIIEALIQGIMSNSGEIINGVVKIVSSLADGILTVVPQLIIAGAQLILNLAQGLAQSIPALIGKASLAVQQLLTAFTQMIPSFLQMGVQILGMLVMGIAQQIPTLLPVAIQAITTLAQGLISMLPMLITIGIQAIMMLGQGLLSSLPQILTSGVQTISMLIQGIVQAIPMLVNAAVMMIPMLISGLAQNIPMIVESGVQIIIELVGGLINGISHIVEAVPKIIRALWDGLTSINWLELGGKIIKGIGSGIVNGLKSLVGIGKDVGEETCSGVSDGISQNTGEVSQAAQGLTNSVNAGLNFNTQQIGSYGNDATNVLQSSLESGLPSLVNTGNNLSNSVQNSMQLKPEQLSNNYQDSLSNITGGITSATPMTVQAADNFTESTNQALMLDPNAGAASVETSLSKYQSMLNSGTGAVVSEAQSMSSQVENAAKTEVEVNIKADATSLDSFKEKIQSFVASSTTQVQTLPGIFQAAFVQVGSSAVSPMNMLRATIEAGMNSVQNTVLSQIQLMIGAFNSFSVKTSQTMSFCMSSIISICNSVNLYSTGVNIMNGLLNGMQSMVGTLLNTARSIASSVSQTMNSTLEVRSPSRVTTATGEFVDMGLINGMQNLSGKVTDTAMDISGHIGNQLEPSANSYTPETAKVSSIRNSNQSNQYSPHFEVNLYGASANDSNKRQVKQWIKECINETFSGMGSSNTELIEV